MLLIGGDKTGDDGWNDRYVPIADRIYDEHLIAIEKEDQEMAKSFKTLRERMTPGAQARAREKTASMMKDMALHELRSARELTQGALAEQLNLEQPAVSKLEHRTDMYVRKYIEAMGGELEIIAHVPEGNVRINQFEELEQGQVQQTVAR